jgi:hypothetical protein
MLRVPADESTYPHPVRFWWFKRLMALGFALVLVVAVVRLAWDRHIAGRLATAGAAALERDGATSTAVTRGEVEADIRDLLDEPLPGDSTAATWLGAEAVLVRDTLRSKPARNTPHTST